MSVDYRAIGTAVSTHLQTELDSAVYLVTQDITAALSQTIVPVSVCVLFSGFSHQESLTQSGPTPTRDASYLIGVVARGESAEVQDVLIDAAVSAIEDACNGPGHGWPIFDYSDTMLERSITTTAGPKTVMDTKGLTTSLTVVIRVMDE